jgi:ABC-type phosphate transport system permease subunit
MIAFFLLVDILAIVSSIFYGLFDRQTLTIFLVKSVIYL